MLDTKELNVGDKVKVVCHSGAKRVVSYVGEVIKKTPKGKVDVKYTIEIVNRFDSNGGELHAIPSRTHYVELDKLG